MWSLSTGICKLLQVQGETDDEVSPTLQVTEIVVQRDYQGVDRFRLLLSDGQSMIYALCTEEVGREVVNNTIEKGCIVQLQEFIITTAKNKKPILIAVAAALLSPPLSVVGNPNNPYVDQGTPAANPGLEGPPAGQQARSSHIDGTTAVAELELGGKFNIRVKVTSRTELRSWSNAKGEGVYFWLTLADVSGAVRGTFFREAAKKFDPVVAEGKAYVFTNCQTKATSKHHPQPNVAAPMVHVHDDPCQPHLHQNDADDGLVPLELVFSNNTTIREVDDAALLAISSGQQSTAVEHVNSMAPGSIVSVLCIISQVSPVATLRNEHVKRTVDITDVTGTVPITFWDDAAHSFSMPVGTVVHFKDLRVVSYQSTVSLSFAHKSSYSIETSSSEAQALRSWWQAPHPAPAGRPHNTPPPDQRQAQRYV